MWEPKWRTSRPRQSCRATTITIMRAFLAVLKKNGRKLAIDPARREPETPGRVRGVDGQTAAPEGADQEDG